MNAGIIAAMAAAAATTLLVVPVRAPELQRLSTVLVAPVPRRGRWRLAVPGASFVVLGWAYVLGGVTAGALSLMTVVLVSTAAVLGRIRVRDRQRRRAAAEVSRACALLAAEVRAGRPPESAVEVVAVDAPVLGAGAEALAIGDDVVRVWRIQAQRPGCGELGALARAWEVSRTYGAPMGPSLDQLAQQLESEADVARTVRGELASAQATGRLMAVLPLVGIGLGYAIGGRPLDFLVHTRVGLACALVATLLGCAGMLWTDALGRAPGRRDG